MGGVVELTEALRVWVPVEDEEGDPGLMYPAKLRVEGIRRRVTPAGERPPLGEVRAVRRRMREPVEVVVGRQPIPPIEVVGAEASRWRRFCGWPRRARRARGQHRSKDHGCDNS